MSHRRSYATAALSVVFAVPAVAPAHAGASAPHQDRVERAVLKKVNAIRAGYGLQRLRTSGALMRSADEKSIEILRTNVLSHSSPDGTPMDQRVRRYVRARVVGETIAFVSTKTRHQAHVIVDNWMASPSHRAAILTPAFRRAGLGRQRGALGGGRAAVVTLNLASAR
jgi:uncharacterized protein YkwD